MFSWSTRSCRIGWFAARKWDCRFYAKPAQPREQIASDHVKMLADALEVSEECALRVLNKWPKVVNKKPEVLKQIPTILDKYGFPQFTFLAVPILLTVSPAFLESRILIYKETGISSNDPVLLARFGQIYKVWLSTLKNIGIIPKTTNVVDNYVQALAIPEKDVEFVHQFVPEKAESVHMRELRSSILIPYLSLLLNCKPEISRKLLKKYPRLLTRSFGQISESVKLLKQLFGLSDEKIQKHGYVLSIPLQNLKSLHASMKTLVGVPLHKIVGSCPKIMSQSVESLQEMERDFESHGIPLDRVAKYPFVLTLSNSTVRSRLEELEQIPELQVLKSHPRVIRLIYYQTKVKKRLKELDTQLVSLNTLAANWKRYERFLDEKARWKGTDIFAILESRIHGKTATELRKKLQENPNWLSCSLVGIKEVLDFLQIEENLADAVIFDALPILLYPIDKVKSAFEETINSGEAKITDSYFLHMVLYMIEKNVNFTGDGIWPSDLLSSLSNFDLDGDDDFGDLENEDLDIDLEVDEDELSDLADDGQDDEELI